MESVIQQPIIPIIILHFLLMECFVHQEVLWPKQPTQTIIVGIVHEQMDDQILWIVKHVA
jgi:hypothetical protein